MDEGDRFVNVDENDRLKIIEDAIPANTRKRNNWSFKLFEQWIKWKKTKWATDGGFLMVLKEFEEYHASDLNFLLQDFVISVRKEDRSEYPPSSLRSIIAGILSTFRDKYYKQWNFFKDPEFQSARRALDAKMRELTRRGVGLNKRKAQVITQDMEEELWNHGVLGSDDPQTLLNTLLYLLGIHFALRSREEHRHLHFGPDSQLKLGMKDNIEYLEYHEDCSKTRHGGLKDRFIPAKEGIVFTDANVPEERNLVLLYKKYVNLRPEDGKCNAFYLKPLRNKKADIWYADQPIGINTISKIVKGMIKEEGHFTNHSLRRTAVSRLNRGGFSIEAVKKRTGHRTSEGVMAYDQKNDEDLRKESNALYGFPENANVATCSSVFCNSTEKSADNPLRGAVLHNCEINFNYYSK